MGNKVTKVVGEKLLSPVLTKADKGVGKLGSKYQTKVDDLFK